MRAGDDVGAPLHQLGEFHQVLGVVGEVGLENYGRIPLRIVGGLHHVAEEPVHGGTVAHR